MARWRVDKILDGLRLVVDMELIFEFRRAAVGAALALRQAALVLVAVTLAGQSQTWRCVSKPKSRDGDRGITSISGTHQHLLGTEFERRD